MSVQLFSLGVRKKIILYISDQSRMVHALSESVTGIDSYNRNHENLIVHLNLGSVVAKCAKWLVGGSAEHAQTDPDHCYLSVKFRK